MEKTLTTLPERAEVEMIQNVPQQNSFSAGSFEHAQRVAKMLSSSNLIPKEFQGNIQNTMIALEMANRIGASPLMVMQNLYIVHGKPSWSSTFIISAINSSGKFSPLRFELTGEKETRTCVAWAFDLATNEKLEGPEVSIVMAKAEGWFDKNGSKWKTMPELMLRYRAAAFFGRLYAPEILMGMQTAEEITDVQVKTVNTPAIIQENTDLTEAIEMMKNANTADDFGMIRDTFSDLAEDQQFLKNIEYYTRKNIKTDGKLF